MAEITSIEFLYNDRVYNALVLSSRRDGVDQYNVTVMDGELERKFFGHHIFLSDNSSFIPKKPCDDNCIAEIQAIVAASLNASARVAGLKLQPQSN